MRCFLWGVFFLLGDILVSAHDESVHHGHTTRRQHRRHRPRASNVAQPSVKAGAGLDVECAMRSVAFDMAMRIPAARRHSKDILDSLQASECPMMRTTVLSEKGTLNKEERSTDQTTATNYKPNDDTVSLYLDCNFGRDENNFGTSETTPLKTLAVAQRIARRLKQSHTTIFIRGGICHLNQTLVLNQSNIAWLAYPGESPVFSGGALLQGMDWSAVTDNIYRTRLPDGITISAIDGLFAFQKGSSILDQIRMVRARYPNGNSENDRMPTNYDKLSGGVSSVDSWTHAGNVSVRFAVEKNSSFYPYFGHSRDIRWVQDYHAENASSYYSPATQFWQPTIATAATFKNVSWGSGAVLHVMHYDWWGNWQWELEQSVSPGLLTFGRGGWQDAHGGPVTRNYFFVENVLQELDHPGEWYVDQDSRMLYLWPLETQTNLEEWNFVVTQLPVIVNMQGEGDLPLQNLRMEGITFAHSTTTYLSEKYEVPSAGDWSVLSKGAVTIINAINVVLKSCTWLQVNGNGLALSAGVHNSSVLDGDFVKVGDSAVVVVGQLPKFTPFSGSDVNTYPTNVTIASCHFGQTGVYGKQSSALFVALARNIQFWDNVLYDGPRAGININDGFGGGHVISRNIIFNQVLESGDHGPINTWSRSAYRQRDASGLETMIPDWNYIDQNFIMIGPKFGSLYGPGMGPCSNGDPNFYCPKNGGSLFSCLDHDDGSEYYLDTRNVCVFAGMKNYIGQNKEWDSNLLIYPEGAASQNRTGMPCIWTSMDMAGNKTELPCSSKPCRTKEVFTNNTCITRSSNPLDYDMFNETDLKLMGNTNTTIPYTARNQYFLKEPYQFHGKWNFSQAQAMGIDGGSEQFSFLPSASMLKDLAQRLLHLPIGTDQMEPATSE